MPAVRFVGWGRGSHPYVGRESDEQPWLPGHVRPVAPDLAPLLLRDHAAGGPNGSPAFVIEDEPPTPPPRKK